MRGATRPARARTKHKNISTHAPLAGRDGNRRGKSPAIFLFQPTRPLRGATGCWRIALRSTERFQPTRPLRGATAHRPRGDRRSEISTHAPLAGRDFAQVIRIRELKAFQPTRPLRGATAWIWTTKTLKKFQPTRPLRGATSRRRCTSHRSTYFNPRAPCGARH